MRETIILFFGVIIFIVLPILLITGLRVAMQNYLGENWTAILIAAIGFILLFRRLIKIIKERER